VRPTAKIGYVRVSNFQRNAYAPWGAWAPYRTETSPLRFLEALALSHHSGGREYDRVGGAESQGAREYASAGPGESVGGAESQGAREYANAGPGESVGGA
jgi:hypothetical protein